MIAYVFQKYSENIATQLFIILQELTREIRNFLKNKTLRLSNLTRTAMTAKITLFTICVKAAIYLLLYNLHDCTFNEFE